MPVLIMEEVVMAAFDPKSRALVGANGRLLVQENDEVTRKLCMLIEGECEGLGPTKAARKFGFSRQRYFQLRMAFSTQGAAALESRKRGPIPWLCDYELVRRQP